MSYIPGSLLSKTNPVKELLEAGLRRIQDPSKWMKGAFSQGGCYCTVGAIRYNDRAPSALEHDTYYKAIVALRLALPKKKGWGKAHGSCDVYEFNDHPNTTHKQVLNLYRRAIKAAGES
jgi:hypothetical protein